MGEASWTIDPVTQVELFVPAWSAAERVHVRAALKREGRLRLIRFSNDWAHPWPLWEPGADHNALGPKDLGLTSDLETELHAWHERWELESSRADPWPELEERRVWERKGAELAGRIQQQVRDFADVLVAHIPSPYLWADHAGGTAAQ